MRARNCYDPNTGNNFVLMFAHNLAQTTANTVARNRATYRARGDKSGAEVGILRPANAHNEKFSAMRLAAFLNVVELRRVR